MSVEELEYVVCSAAVDEQFLDWFIASPADAITRFDLSYDEQQMLVSLQARSLMDLAHGVAAWRQGRALPRRRSVAAVEPAARVG